MSGLDASRGRSGNRKTNLPEELKAHPSKLHRHKKNANRIPQKRYKDLIIIPYVHPNQLAGHKPTRAESTHQQLLRRNVGKA